MLFYETGYGGAVFSAGSLSFGNYLAKDPELQKLVQNVLDAC